MPLRSILALALVALAAAGCAGGQRARFERVPPGTTSTSDRSITLTRGSCEGLCWDYDLTLHGDGIVEMYGGGGAVRAVSERWRIDAAAARAVFAVADSLRIDELPPAIGSFCTFHIQDRPLTRIALRNGDARHVTSDEFCGTLLDEIRHQDTVIVRGVRVSTDAFRSSPEMQKWARDNDGRFVRESLIHPMWVYRPGEDLDRDSVLVSDSLARRYLGRLRGIASAVDSTTGAPAWAEAHESKWARRQRQEWAQRERRRQKRAH